MTDEEVEKIIRDYIPQIIHLSLATVSGQRPWVCELHFAYDNELNLYFGSSLNRRHSKEILANPHVAGNIVTQHHKDQKVRGVYFEGTAEALQGIDQHHPAYKAYTTRFEHTRLSLLDQIRKDGNAALFKITVQNYYLFDAYEADRGKFKLAWHEKEIQ